MRLTSLLAALVCAALLAACGSGDEATTSANPTTEAAPGAFPVTIEHKYGSATIDKQPERVVVVGLREQDSLLALGVVPVATTEWYGKHPGAIFPWATDELGSAKPPVVLTNTDGTQIDESTSFPSVLSMETLMKELVPRLAAAADGDPKTSTDQTG